MAETKQLAFDLTELATALIKHQGIHEGIWMAGFEFGFSTAHLGPTPDEVRPSLILQVSKALLIRAEPGHPSSLLVDAAVVNPPTKSVRAARSGIGR